MPLYIYQAAYTPESVAAQIREPADRFEAVRPAFEAMGGKIVVGGYPFGEYDMLAVIEAPDDTTAAGFALAVVAGGAVRSASTARLLDGEEWVEASARSGPPRPSASGAAVSGGGSVGVQRGDAPPSAGVAALLLRFGIRLGGRQAVVRLLVVVAWVGERVRAHAPRSVRKGRSKPPRTK
jgi:uncharacterized protein with GYD domain